MLTSEVITQVRSQFSDPTGVQLSDADIINFINNALRDIAYGANLIQTRAVTDVIAGTSEYIIPQDILTMFNVWHNGLVLQSLSIQEANAFIQNYDDPSNVNNGTPTHYWLWANTIRLYPTPTQHITDGLRAYYTRLPNKVALVSDTIDLPLAFLTPLIDKVLSYAHEKDENWEAANIKGTQADTMAAKISQDSSFDEHDVYPSITTSPRDSGDMYNNVGVYQW